MANTGKTVKYVGTVILGVGAGIAGYYLGDAVSDSVGLSPGKVKYVVEFGMAGAFSVVGGFAGYSILERVIGDV